MGERTGATQAEVILGNIKGWACWEFQAFRIEEKDKETVIKALELLVEKERIEREKSV